ncbi:hypothetical protein EAI_09989, partial [Harpegnathos saltator]
KRFSLSSLIFIFGAEITALLHALRISDERNLNKAIIATDSRSAVSSILKVSDAKYTHPWIILIKDILYQLHRRGTIVKLLWIPSHCDIVGNERTDALTKKA